MGNYLHIPFKKSVPPTAVTTTTTPTPTPTSVVPAQPQIDVPTFLKFIQQVPRYQKALSGITKSLSRGDIGGVIGQTAEALAPETTSPETTGIPTAAAAFGRRGRRARSRISRRRSKRRSKRRSRRRSRRAVKRRRSRRSRRVSRKNRRSRRRH